MNWYNIWKWPVEIIDDIRQWMIVRSATQEPSIQDRFSKFRYPLRVDRIGRIYTVINIPDELLSYQNQDAVWPWVLGELRSIDDLLMECRLNDLVYPEVSPIPDNPAYLVILSPSTESFSIWKFLRWIFNCIVVGGLFFILNRICVKVFDSSAIDLFLSLF
jgi:hypothetical protein